MCFKVVSSNKQSGQQQTSQQYRDKHQLRALSPTRNSLLHISLNYKPIEQFLFKYIGPKGILAKHTTLTQQQLSYMIIKIVKM